MIDRRAFITTVGGGILAGPLVADAQPAGKMWRLGFLSPGSAGLPEALRQGLRDLGYEEGKNIVIDRRGAEGSYDRLPSLAAELVHAKVDIIVTHGTPGIRAAGQATATIPIVMAISGEAVGNRFVASLARPGGNITGLSFQNRDLHLKRLELFKEAVPNVRRVAVLLHADNVPMAFKQFLVQEARPLKLELQTVEVRDENEFDGAFARLAKGRVDAVTVHDDVFFSPRWSRIAGVAIKTRLPTIGSDALARAGGLIGYGVNFDALFRRAAVYVDKILKGAKPGDIPVEQPTKFELVINLKTAKALGLTIPPSVLGRADQVIE